ncbi:unnamed protein product [Brachionus calyciflorus]|uniref:Uncharacterized protein n=1 Tax=Brachionus calyciflorus TaxID=104777 RepID=A0A813NIG3_9BILA|nr:unnamed protein product [Brachionus calyciflorus]
MEVETFMMLYNQSIEKKELFSFKVLLNQLNVLTPEIKGKQQVPYSSEQVNLIKNCQNSIVRNFCNNPVIKKNPDINPLVLTKLANFFKSCDFSEQKLAQCLFLIHAAKTDCHLLEDIKARELFVSYWEKFDTITIKTNYDSVFQEFFSIFKTLFQSRNFIDIINKSIDEIVVSKPGKDTYNFNNLKLVFFESEFPSVNGYSGKDCIYLNAKNVLNSFELPLENEKKLLVAKLNFISLVLHEASHVLLRFKLNDLNLSSPFLDDRVKKNEVKKNVKECGFETEKKYFKGCIAWNISAIHKIDFTYCEGFLNNILNDKKVDFEIEKANVEIYNDELFHSSGFSIVFESGFNFFF